MSSQEITLFVNNSSAISQLFGDKATSVEKKLNKVLFPKNNEERKTAIEDLALLRLAYLASIGDASSKSPFTQNQMKILRSSDRENCLTVCGLRSGIIICAVTVIGASYLGLAQANNSSIGFQAGIATIVAVANTVTTALSFWATGFAPHAASNAFNDKQDMLLEMEEIYEDLAYKLIDCYYSPRHEIAYKITEHIDVERLKRVIAVTIHSTQRAVMIVKRLDEAVKFIRSNQSEQLVWPDNTKFKSFILEKKRDFDR